MFVSRRRGAGRGEETPLDFAQNAQSYSHRYIACMFPILRSVHGRRRPYKSCATRPGPSKLVEGAKCARRLWNSSRNNSCSGFFSTDHRLAPGIYLPRKRHDESARAGCIHRVRLFVRIATTVAGKTQTMNVRHGRNHVLSYVKDTK